MRSNLKNIVIDKKFYYQLCFIFCLVAIFSVPINSFAADDAISQTLCNVIVLLTGTIGKGIATIAIIVLGIGLFLGKLSWAVAVATAIGIGLIFGAGTMVSWIGAGAANGVTACQQGDVGLNN